MADLRNTIAHILEHKQHLVDANEATIQQYVVLPILRALEWDDTNLASMEILPEYKVESRRADYALHIQREQNPMVLIECKRWNQAIGRNEEQICFYAYSGNVPLAIITNGKLWRFYLSRWEASSLSDRIFCETDIENREGAIANLEKYLLKSNVVSGEAGLNAEIALEEEADASEPSSINPDSDFTGSIIDDQPEEGQTPVSSEISGAWTVERVIDSLSKEVKDDHEKYDEERRKLFYRGAAGVQNLVEKERWRLDLKLRKVLCGFFLKDRGVTGIRRIFGIILPVHLPHGSSVDRNGKVIGGSLKSTPPRLLVKIMKEEAEQLEHQYGCEFCAVSTDAVYYYIPDDITELRPVLEFAYKKHSGN